ncbi:wd repeat domain phosphoinositide-interacting protein [Anaeramoeba flamelloides]|uniref:Wd repeat domain phosphoinositide-interacting protein n=1 Tax=Anaeramoeba flamelloides TaxID=1746091 RepID=A0ABQ8YRB6_9EUKA|nr:wd repeat domain phosphoinositide-interacting protein [Anaeramoeba flamelloides]
MSSELTETLYLSINPQNAFFSVGTTSNWSVYSINPFQKKFTRSVSSGGVSIVEMLSSSNIFGLVGNDQTERLSKSNLYIWDDFKKENIIELKFRETIYGLRLSHHEIFVVLNNDLHIYDFSTLKLIDQISTFDNEQGIIDFCELPNSHDLLALVTLGPRKGTISIKRFEHRIQSQETSTKKLPKKESGSEQGTLKTKEIKQKIQNEKETNVQNLNNSNKNNPEESTNQDNSNTTDNKTNTTSNQNDNTNISTSTKSNYNQTAFVIQIDDSGIGNVVISPCGRFVAACGIKGTIIKIYSCITGELITEKKRGTKRAIICDMAFHPECKYLIATSRHGTIHVFSLAEVENFLKKEKSLLENNKEKENSSFVFFGSKQKRADFKGKISKDQNSKCSFLSDQQIIAITESGEFYKFVIDLKNNELRMIEKKIFLQNTKIQKQEN